MPAMSLYACVDCGETFKATAHKMRCRSCHIAWRTKNGEQEGHNNGTNQFAKTVDLGDVCEICHFPSETEICSVCMPLRLRATPNWSTETDNMPRGITKLGDRYRARLSENGEKVYVGTFDTVEQAVAARKAKMA